MRAILKAAAGLCLLLLTSACLVETEATLADPDAATADARLLGTWYYAERGEVTLFSVAEDEKEKGVYRVVFASIRPNADTPVESAQYRVWRTVLNGRDYLNAERVGEAKDMPALAIISYDVTASTLVLRLMDTKRVIAAIEVGRLKGRVKKGTYVDEVTITSPRAELAAFIAAADRETLFATKTGALRKLAETPN